VSYDDNDGIFFYDLINLVGSESHMLDLVCLEC